MPKENKNTAYFVKHPRHIGELQQPHLLSCERTYRIVRETSLADINYENFVTDMGADRRFLEDKAAECAEGAPMKCLLVRQRGKTGGILVIPDGTYVKWAAYLPESKARP